MKKKTIKYDIILISIVLIICGLFFILQNHSSGSMIKITCQKEVIGYYSLDKDQTIKVNDSNIVVIKNHEVYMLEAKCPDHLCIKQGHIKDQGASIICLPNQVIVEIVEGEDGDYDSKVF